MVASVFASAAGVAALLAENMVIALLFFVASGLFFLDAFIQPTSSRKPSDRNDSM